MSNGLASVASGSDFKLHRLAMLMEPEPGNPQEVEGVLNPAAVRGPDGKLYLFPRLVAKGNYSRIGIARVVFNPAGDPASVERLGIALEPEAENVFRSCTFSGSGGRHAQDGSGKARACLLLAGRSRGCDIFS
jgi:hypothetical protein